MWLRAFIATAPQSFAMFLAHAGFNNNAMRVQKAKGIEEWK
jgi:hypothetical protein